MQTLYMRRRNVFDLPKYANDLKKTAEKSKQMTIVNQMYVEMCVAILRFDYVYN